MGKPRSLKDTCRHCGRVVKWGPVGLTYAALLSEEYRSSVHGWNERWHHVVLLPPLKGEKPSMRDLIRCPNDSENDNGWRGPVATPKSFCGESTQDYGTCNRPVKDRGQCGIHLRRTVEEERQAEERRERTQIQQHVLESTNNLIEELERLGLDGAKPEYKPHSPMGDGHYTGMVVVNPAELLRFIKPTKPIKTRAKK